MAGKTLQPYALYASFAGLNGSEWYKGSSRVLCAIANHTYLEVVCEAILWLSTKPRHKIRLLSHLSFAFGPRPVTLDI